MGGWWGWLRGRGDLGRWKEGGEYGGLDVMQLKNLTVDSFNWYLSEHAPRSPLRFMKPQRDAVDPSQAARLSLGRAETGPSQRNDIEVHASLHVSTARPMERKSHSVQVKWSSTWDLTSTQRLRAGRPQSPAGERGPYHQVR